MDIDRRESDDGELRWYTDGESEYLSVTTVLKFLEEDEGGLDYWKSQNDGSGDNPHHEHIFWYSGPRGTLLHYEALSQFADREMWGEEEADSYASLLTGPSEEDTAIDEASTDIEDVTYSIMRYQGVVQTRQQYDALFDSTRLIDIYEHNKAWFLDAFDDICTQLGVTSDDVIEVEKYLLHELTVDGERVGYGGQADLLYEAADGATVLADLKTSSSLRQKNMLQGHAYAQAIEASDEIPVESIDRLEVWRCYPDDERWQIHSHEIPAHATHLIADNREGDWDYYTTDNWFDDEWGDYQYDSLAEQREKFNELIVKASEAVSERSDSTDDDSPSETNQTSHASTEASSTEADDDDT